MLQLSLSPPCHFVVSVKRTPEGEDGRTPDKDWGAQIFSLDSLGRIHVGYPFNRYKCFPSAYFIFLGPSLFSFVFLQMMVWPHLMMTGCCSSSRHMQLQTTFLLMTAILIGCHRLSSYLFWAGPLLLTSVHAPTLVFTVGLFHHG